MIHDKELYQRLKQTQGEKEAKLQSLNEAAAADAILDSLSIGGGREHFKKNNKQELIGDPD